MKLNRLILFRILVPAFLAAGCTSTDVIEPSSPSGKSDLITLTVSAPEAVLSSTRADETHAGHQLRYVAELYKANGNYPINKDNFIARKELLASEGSLIQFQAPETGKYVATLFADYIPESTTKDDNGHYPDKYYRTMPSQVSEYGKIGILGNGNSELPPYSINNDNYDCFSKTLNITKEAATYEATISLTRAVAKIIVQDKGENSRPEGVSVIKLGKLSFMSEYSFEPKTNYSATNKNVENSGYTLDYNGSDAELFYFYTLPAADSNGFYINGKGLAEINFQLVAKDNYAYDKCSIQGALFYPKANHIYRVKGNFLKPTNAPPLPGDMINLTVSIDNGWNSQEVSVENN